MPLIDAALRGALVALLLLMATRLFCDRRDAPAARIGAMLMLCLTVQVFNSLPLSERSGPWWWQAPLLGISVGNSVLFWVFAQSLFDDDFSLRARHIFSWLAAVALGMLFFAVVVMPQQRALGGFALAVDIAVRWTPIVFAALVLVAAASQWRADLVERRRSLRAFVIAMGTAYTILSAIARLTSSDGRLSDWESGLDTAMLLVIVGTLAVRLLRTVESELLPVPAGAGRTPGAPVAVIPGPDPSDDRLVGALQLLMREERAYRAEGLTIARLAGRLKAPEYRVRRLINVRLGHRNFNAYINGLRLDEAQKALADPRQRELPVLTIALEAGFQSIGPFNRAFKAATGLTPTEYRRQKLADS